MVTVSGSHIGNVFSIPVDDRRHGHGQIVARYGRFNYYFAVFEQLYSSDTELRLDEIVSDKISFLALSLDILIEIGRWKTLGNGPIPPDLPLPAYRESYSSPRPRVDVVDYSGQRRRPSTTVEAALLPNRIVFAPIRFEKALKALHGLTPWDSDYDRLRPTNLTTTRYFGKDA